MNKKLRNKFKLIKSLYMDMTNKYFFIIGKYLHYYKSKKTLSKIIKALIIIKILYVYHIKGNKNR